MKKLLFSIAMATAVLPAMAHTDLLNENFNGSWTDNFSSLELDGKAPAASINSSFMDSQGVSQPWWPVKDVTTSSNRFMASHSYYNPVGQSNDWLVSRALTVPTKGFKLTFGAQSLPIRSGDAHALSDLRVYITEQPVTKDWQPAEPTLLLENVGYGEDRDNCEGDFLPFEINLDEYAGKTIYISFANLNNDKDVLVIDDVLVRRLDNAEITAEAPEYVVAGDFNVHATVNATNDEGLVNWKLTFKCGDISSEESGASLAAGESKEFDFTAVAEANKANEYTLTLTADNIQVVDLTGVTTGLMFQTTKRIMLEETTGTWCGNCPMAMYTLEVIDESEYADRVLPISIHVGNDPMVVDEYEYMFGLGAVAPFIRIDRLDELIGVTPLDCYPDLNNPQTAAASIIRHLDAVALVDIDVTGSYLMNAGKPSGIDATVELAPAIDIDGSKYLIGFVLTENNVEPATTSNSWIQHNYVSKDALGRSVGNPWAYLPGDCPKFRFQDVARQIYGFRGLEESMPADVIKAGEKYTYKTRLGLPTPNLGELNPENLYLTAFLIERDKSICTVLNANRVALGDNPEEKYTARQYANDLFGIDLSGVESVGEDVKAEAEYFNLQGIRVNEPVNGIYIVRRGNKVTKEMVR